MKIISLNKFCKNKNAKIKIKFKNKQKNLWRLKKNAQILKK